MRNIYKIMIWNQTKECMDREQMRLLQGARLKKLVHRVYHHTPFYRDKMQQMGLTPDDIDTIDDIVKLPFTTKQDLRDNYPYGLFAAPQSEIIGGYIPKYENGASEIAGQIADFYKKKPRAVHFDPTENEYRFDLQKLKEFGIAEYKLPSGSIVVDTVEARLQKYESYILILIVIFIVLSLFIAFLYYLYYRNKKLKISLENRGRELIAAKEKAEESDMLKSAFLANMSHEIRTPLNAIVGFSALLGDESISEEDRNVYMGIVNQNSDLLLTLIGDILDISRLETGKISFTLHPENIVAICQQVISTTAHGRKKDVECVFNPPVESFILKTDSQRLSQVLINLLTNASKFTEKGTIALAFEIQKEQRRILFSVSDTGCGIPRERQERVFNRFEKLNEFKQGTGLGLAICKQIVLRFGGNIWIDPEYTEGARFVFSHPIVP